MSIEWPLVFFSIFTGIACGMFFSLVYLAEYQGKALDKRLKVSILVLICMAAGGFCAQLHLGHPERMFGALGHPTSGIFMEAAVEFTLGAIIVAYILAVRREAGAAVTKILGIIGAVVAAVMAFINGDTFVMASRPAWNTLFLPICYIASAGVLGAFALNLLLGEDEDAHYALQRLLLKVIGVQAVVLLLYLVMVAIAPYPDYSRSLQRIFVGDIAPLSWLGILIVGMGLPVKFIKDGKAAKMALTSFICVLAGALSFRIMMFLIGSSVRNFFG